MIKWLRKYRNILLLLIVAGLLVFLAKSCGAGGTVSGAEAAAREALSPADRVAAFFGNFFDFSTKHALQAQVSELETQLAEKEAKLQIADEIQAENERLRQLLEIKESYAGQWNMVTAKVVSRDINNWYESITIDKGSNDGLANDMAVVDKSGLVGRLANVTQNTADVLLIVDSMGSLGAMLQNSRTQGVLAGIGGGKGLLKLKNLPYNADVQLNEIIVTSGQGGVFPAGIQVGTVVKVSSALNGLSQEVIVEPFSDFDKLEEVLVLTTKMEKTDTAANTGQPSAQSGNTDHNTDNAENNNSDNEEEGTGE